MVYVCRCVAVRTKGRLPIQNVHYPILNSLCEREKAEAVDDPCLNVRSALTCSPIRKSHKQARPFWKSPMGDDITVPDDLLLLCVAVTDLSAAHLRPLS